MAFFIGHWSFPSSLARSKINQTSLFQLKPIVQLLNPHCIRINFLEIHQSNPSTFHNDADRSKTKKKGEVEEKRNRDKAKWRFFIFLDLFVLYLSLSYRFTLSSKYAPYVNKRTGPRHCNRPLHHRCLAI